jgi:hypothetical protein
LEPALNVQELKRMSPVDNHKPAGSGGAPSGGQVAALARTTKIPTMLAVKSTLNESKKSRMPNRPAAELFSSFKA